MSDISTTLSNIPNPTFFNSFFNMTNEGIQQCSMFQFKLVLFLIFVCILTSCLATLISPIEPFSNNEIFSYSDAIKPNYSNYQTLALTAPSTKEGNPSNLLFGQANRIITTIDNKMTLELNIFANLFVLNGNPFGQNDINKDFNKKQNYLVYTNSKLTGELKKDGDGVYKLKLKTKDQNEIKELISNNELSINYKVDNKEITLLKGNFTK